MLVKVKQEVAVKTDGVYSLVWGLAKRTLNKLLHVDPEVSVILIKGERMVSWEKR